MIKLFMGHLVGSAVLLKDLRAQKKIYELRQKYFQEAKEKYFKDQASLRHEDRFKYLTLQRGLLLGKAWLSWCEEVEVFLQERS